MFNIKSKRNIILFSSVAFLIALVIIPSILAYSGTAYPIDLELVEGHLEHGDLDEDVVKWDDGDYILIRNEHIAWLQFFVKVNVYFDSSIQNVGSGNSIRVNFRNLGSAPLSIYTYYTDGTHDEVIYWPDYYWHTKVFSIDSYKTVDYVKFYVHNAFIGNTWLYIDQVIVNY